MGGKSRSHDKTITVNWLLIEADNEVLCTRVRIFLQKDYPQIDFDIVKGEQKNFCIRACDIEIDNAPLLFSLGYSLGYYVRMCRE